MSGALDYSQYRIDDIVERIEKEIEQATCERPPLVTEQGVCVKRKTGEGCFNYPLWLNGFRTFESAEKYFKENGYKEFDRSEENGERKLVMLDPALDESTKSPPTPASTIHPTRTATNLSTPTTPRKH